MQIKTTSPEETRILGAKLADKSTAGMVYGLIGNLGTGKTELVRGFVAALTSKAVVRSPSFSLVNTYETGAFPVHHFDFYRLADISELFEIGFTDYLGGDAVCLIEWADMFPDALPEDTKYIRLHEESETVRMIEIESI
jgi:tRNA threonylcarbamoyladenosine biosynthesis protein TsaE